MDRSDYSIPCIAMFVALTFTSDASAIIAFDAASEFSALSNPNGVWSYGYGSASIGPMSLLLADQNRFEPALLPGWARDAAPVTASLPAVYHNPGAAPVPVSDYPAAVDPGALVVHPGDLADEGFVFVRFTAPAASDYDISAVFEALDTTDGAQSLVVVNGASTLFDQTIVGFGNSTMFDSAASVSLALGDTIDFIVGNGGSFTNDSVQLDAFVTQIPAPSAAAVLACLGFAGASRRRTR